MNIEWKPIPGWVNYEASSRGQIRSVERTELFQHAHAGFTRRNRVGSVLKSSMRGRYLKVELYMTPSNNNLQKALHGTHQGGERSGTAVLSNDTVEEIRRKYAAGAHSQRALASEYGVSQRSIWRYVNGKSYR